jgi:hypothetical protein
MSLCSSLARVDILFPFKRKAFAIDDHAVFAVLRIKSDP